MQEQCYMYIHVLIATLLSCLQSVCTRTLSHAYIHAKNFICACRTEDDDLDGLTVHSIGIVENPLFADMEDYDSDSDRKEKRVRKIIIATYGPADEVL